MTGRGWCFICSSLVADAQMFGVAVGTGSLRLLSERHSADKAGRKDLRRAIRFTMLSLISTSIDEHLQTINLLSADAWEDSDPSTESNQSSPVSIRARWTFSAG